MTLVAFIVRIERPRVADDERRWRGGRGHHNLVIIICHRHDNRHDDVEGSATSIQAELDRQSKTSHQRKHDPIREGWIRLVGGR